MEERKFKTKDELIKPFVDSITNDAIRRDIDINERQEEIKQNARLGFLIAELTKDTTESGIEKNFNINRLHNKL